MILNTIYIGRKINTSKKIDYCYQMVNENNRIISFNTKHHNYGSIGSMIVFESKDNKTFRKGKNKDEFISDKSLINKFIIRDKAAYEESLIYKKMSKINDKEYELIKQELIRITRLLNKTQKRIFIQKMLIELL